MKNESIPGMDDINILSGEVYDSMYPAESVYICQNDDLAVIRFESEEDLSVIETDDSDPEMGDRIMCVGNPQNEWFSVSYGEILSGIEKFGESTGYPSRALKHSAYISGRKQRRSGHRRGYEADRNYSRRDPVSGR